MEIAQFLVADVWQLPNPIVGLRNTFPREIAESGDGMNFKGCKTLSTELTGLELDVMISNFDLD